MESRSLWVQIPLQGELCLHDPGDFIFIFYPGPQNQSSADALDIDPNAVDVAYSNLALNNLPKDNYNAFYGNRISRSLSL